MRIELVLDNYNLLGLWKMNIDQVTHTIGPIHFGASVCDFDTAPILEWRKEHEHVGNTFTLVLVVVLLWLSELHRQGLAGFSDQLFRALVEAHQRAFRG